MKVLQRGVRDDTLLTNKRQIQARLFGLGVLRDVNVGMYTGHIARM